MTHDELEAKLNVAEEHNKHSDYVNAEIAAREILHNVAEENESDYRTYQVRALLTLSDSLWPRGLANDALPFAQQALALSTDETVPTKRKLKGNALSTIGLVYETLAQYEKAHEYYEKARTLLEEIGDPKGAANVTGNIGNIFWKI